MTYAEWNQRAPAALPAPQPGVGGEAEDKPTNVSEEVYQRAQQGLDAAHERISATPPIALPVREACGGSYTLDPERKNEGGGLMAAGILKDGELVAIASGAGEEGLARIVAQLSERKTIHEWLNGCGIPREEHGKPICLLRRLRIACDNLAALSRELEEAKAEVSQGQKLLRHIYDNFPADGCKGAFDRVDLASKEINHLRAELTTLRTDFQRAVDNIHKAREEMRKHGQINEAESLSTQIATALSAAPRSETEGRDKERLALLPDVMLAMEQLDKWADWIRDVSREMDSEPGQQSVFESEIAMVKRTYKNLSAALAHDEKGAGE